MKKIFLQKDAEAGIEGYKRYSSYALTLITVLITHVVVLAQQRVGITSGLAKTSLQNSLDADYLTVSGTTQFTAGLTTSWRFKKQPLLGMEVQLLYIKIAEKYSSTTIERGPGLPIDLRASTALSYIKLPVRLNIYLLPQAKIHPHAGLGLFASRLIRSADSCTVVFNSLFAGVVTQNSSWVNDYYYSERTVVKGDLEKRPYRFWDAGLSTSVGVEAEITESIVADLSLVADFGFLDVENKEVSEPDIPNKPSHYADSYKWSADATWGARPLNRPSTTTRSYALMLSLAYKFGHGR